MRALRHAARRRRHRALRVVGAAGRTAGPQLFPGDAGALAVGLTGAWLLRQHFPDFADAEGVVTLPATLPQLLGCCAAFWHLIDTAAGREILRWPEDDGGDLSPADTPSETLRAFDGVTAEWMAGTIGMHITEPQPHYWGWGVESLFDDEMGEVSDVLALTLWHLFDHTGWSLGVDLSEVVEEQIDLETVTRLRPLPSDAPIEQLQLTIPEAERFGVPSSELLRYPFARCANDLANHTEYEIDGIHYGEFVGGANGVTAWDWDDLPELITAAKQAPRIAEAYKAWCERVTKNPVRELPLLAAEIRASAREAALAHAGPITLAELLANSTEGAPIGSDADIEELLV